MQRFSNRKNYEEHFVRMLDAANHIPIWVFSCNDSSWAGIDHIVKTIRKFKKDIVIESTLYDYNYRKKNSSSENEHLIVAR